MVGVYVGNSKQFVNCCGNKERITIISNLTGYLTITMRETPLNENWRKRERECVLKGF